MISNERKCFTSGEDIEDSPFLAALVDSTAWENFLKEKIEKQHLRKTEEEKNTLLYFGTKIFAGSESDSCKYGKREK